MRVSFSENDLTLGVSFGEGQRQPATTFDITPGPEAQEITPPDGYVFSSGRVGPIPSNYGLITYSGFALTVS